MRKIKLKLTLEEIDIVNCAMWKVGTLETTKNSNLLCEDIVVIRKKIHDAVDKFVRKREENEN